MTLNVASYSGGVTAGTITNVDLVMRINSILGTCTAEIAGAAGFAYTNSSRALQLTASGDSLKTTSTAGSCAGLLSLGDVWTLTGSLTVTGSPTNPIQISQP